MIPPEGCASILWRDAALAQDAAEALKLTAHDLKTLGIIDIVIPEPLGGAHRQPATVISAVGEALDSAIKEFVGLEGDVIKAKRREKFLAMGKQELG